MNKMMMISAQCQPDVSPMSARCQPSVSPMSAQCQPYVSPIPAIFQPNVRQMSAQCQPHVCPISALCQLYTISLSSLCFRIMTKNQQKFPKIIMNYKVVKIVKLFQFNVRRERFTPSQPSAQICACLYQLPNSYLNLIFCPDGNNFQRRLPL